jgi:hypothetical protein
MVLTKFELHMYRSLVGVQFAFAESGDAHKVAELQLKLIALIEKICKRYLIDKTGEVWGVSMNDQAKAEYALMVGRSFEAAGEGMDAWKISQGEIEAWVSGYIESAYVQVSARITGTSEN